MRYAVALRRGDARASFVMDHGRVGPPGILGGDPGQPNRIEIFQSGRKVVPLHLSKDQDIEMHAGDVIRVQTPGGGGYGPSSDRSSLLIQRDKQYGYGESSSLDPFGDDVKKQHAAE